MKGDEGKRPIMRRKTSPIILSVFIALLITLALMLFLQPDDVPDLEDEKAPTFEYVDVDHNHIDFNDSVGRRPILLVFIYTESHWCGELTANMKEMYEDYYWGDGLEFVTVSAHDEDSIEDVRNFRDSYEANWTFVKVPSSVGSSYQVRTTPTIFVIDHEGIVREIRVGYRTVQAMKDIIEPYL